jgi:hypothetical protein
MTTVSRLRLYAPDDLLIASPSTKCMRRISAHCSTWINSSSWPRLYDRARLRSPPDAPGGVTFQPAEEGEYSGGVNIVYAILTLVGWLSTLALVVTGVIALARWRRGQR